MALTSTLGAKLYTNSTPLLGDLENFVISNMTSLAIDTEVGLISEFTEFGINKEVFSYTGATNGTDIKLISSYDNGGFQFSFGFDPELSGQDVLRSNSLIRGQVAYPFKLKLQGSNPVGMLLNEDGNPILNEDGRPILTEEDYNIYFGAKIVSLRTLLGGVNSTIVSTVQLVLVTEIFFDF